LLQLSAGRVRAGGTGRGADRHKAEVSSWQFEPPYGASCCMAGRASR
jgi:hypothetical protein